MDRGRRGVEIIDQLSIEYTGAPHPEGKSVS
jgi:hypothetical protein